MQVTTSETFNALKVTYSSGDAGSSVGDEEDKESRIGEDTMCTLHGNEWTPASVNCGAHVFPNQSQYIKG